VEDGRGRDRRLLDPRRGAGARILEPIADVPFRSRFAAVTIGFMGNNLLPARLGEFLRAYSLSRMEPVPIVASFGRSSSSGCSTASRHRAAVHRHVAARLPGWSAGEGDRVRRLRARRGASSAWSSSSSPVRLVLMPRRAVSLVASASSVYCPQSVRRPVVDALEAFLTASASCASALLLRAPPAGPSCSGSSTRSASGSRSMPSALPLPFTAALFFQSAIALAVSVPSGARVRRRLPRRRRVRARQHVGRARRRAGAFAVGFHLAGFIPVTLIGLYYAWRIGFLVPRTHRRARAKVNLFLRVLAREESRLTTSWRRCCAPWRTGRHASTIESRRQRRRARACAGAELGDPRGNLVYPGCHRLFRCHRGRAGGAHPLEKQIPHGAGLGGGSSDAAATLRLLDALHGNRLGIDRLLRIGSTIGADVPFFVTGAPAALAWGRGERLLPVAAPPARELLLVVPDTAMATAQAYAALARRRGRLPSTPRAARHDPDALRDWEWIARAARNDFEAVVFERIRRHRPCARPARRARRCARPAGGQRLRTSDGVFTTATRGLRRQRDP
jgi:4-diphosphocytidyl-2-C-methyl-D-erythritol kinase